MNLDELELSVRAYNCLIRAGITTTEELCDKTIEDMMRVRNLGRRRLEELLDVMKTHGLKFRENEDDTAEKQYLKFNIICSDGYMIKVAAQNIESVMNLVSLYDANGAEHEVMRIAEIREDKQ